MNKKDNQRTRLTRMLMKQAYLQLMSEKPTGRITVRDICDRSEINRSTFYLHYQEPNDILIELEDETILKVREALYAIGALDDGATDVSKYMLSFFDYVRRNEELFRALLINNSDPHFRRKMLEITEEITLGAFRVRLDQELSSAVYLYIVSGSLEVLTEWIRSGFSMPEQTLCNVLYRLCEGGLRSIAVP